MKRTKNKIGLIFKIVHGMMRTTSKILCIISPGLAARWADMLFFIPIGLPRPTSELPYYESAVHSSIKYNGKKVALYTWGEGDKTIILVHGWGSRGTRMGHLAEPLNKIGYRVVAFDAPAHGDSEGKTTNLFDVSEIINLIYEKFEPVHTIIGHSFGGMALTNAVHRNDLSVSKVAVIASPFSMDYIIESFRKVMNINSKVTELMVERIKKRFLKEKNLDVFSLSLDSFASSFEIPILVIHDKEDRDVAYEQGKEYADNFPNAVFISTAGLGHRRILKDAEIINKIIEFITSS